MTRSDLDNPNQVDRAADRLPWRAGERPTDQVSCLQEHAAAQR